MQMYGNTYNPVKELDASYIIFKDQLQLLDEIMTDFDMSKFVDGTNLDRLTTLNKGIEYVQKEKETETRFMGITLRMKKAFDLCVGDDRITDLEITKVHFYTAIRSAIYKTTSGEKPDSTRMNAEVKKLVDACILASSDIYEEEVNQGRNCQRDDLYGTGKHRCSDICERSACGYSQGGHKNCGRSDTQIHVYTDTYCYVMGI